MTSEERFVEQIADFAAQSEMGKIRISVKAMGGRVSGKDFEGAWIIQDFHPGPTGDERWPADAEWCVALTGSLRLLIYMTVRGRVGGQWWLVDTLEDLSERVPAEVVAQLSAKLDNVAPTTPPVGVDD